jgi:hypothetical protein
VNLHRQGENAVVVVGEPPGNGSALPWSWPHVVAAGGFPAMARSQKKARRRRISLADGGISRTESVRDARAIRGQEALSFVARPSCGPMARTVDLVDHHRRQAVRRDQPAGSWA